jgi:hypothetical protein
MEECDDKEKITNSMEHSSFEEANSQEIHRMEPEGSLPCS